MFAKTPELPAAAGWAAEGGGRYFGSLGRYGEDFGFLPSTPAPAISSISRLTFQDMQTNSGEFFGRIDTPWDLFVKGYVGGGTSGHSHLNDEDFLVGLGGGPFPYSNTLSPIVDGRIGYRAIDAGYDFLRGSKSERSPATFSSFAALLVTAFYLALSGAEVATTTPVHHDCDRAHRRHASWADPDLAHGDIASLPGAFGRIPAFGTGPLLLGTAGLLVIEDAAALERGRACDHRGAARTPAPDVLVGASGRTFAVRGGGDGRLAFHHTGGDTFATREWFAADADGRDVDDASLGNGIACDPPGCIGKLADGQLVSHALAPDALEEDCERAIIVVTARDPPPGCAAMVVGRSLWRERSALTLRRDGSGFVMESARPLNFDRPLAPAPLPRHTPPASQASGVGTPLESSPPARRDAAHRRSRPE